MNLDFAALLGAVSTQPARKPRGQAGTLGTQALMRALGAAGVGDRPGTGGDGNAATTGNIKEVAPADGFPPVPCPQVSPARPRYPEARKINQIKVSPASPGVPGFAGNNASGADFNHEAFEERAAIMEFDGGLTRDEAESAALAVLGAAA